VSLDLQLEPPNFIWKREKVFQIYIERQAFGDLWETLTCSLPCNEDYRLTQSIDHSSPHAILRSSLHFDVSILFFPELLLLPDCSQCQCADIVTVLGMFEFDNL